MDAILSQLEQQLEPVKGDGSSTVQSRIDHLQSVLQKMPQQNCPIINRFTPGLYVREIFMPQGTMVISKIHKTEHPFVLSKGRVSVWSENDGIVHLSAPHCGITKPGTRRVIYIHEDCVWLTFHPTTETDIEKIEAALIQPHVVGETIEVAPETIEQLKEAQ